MATTWIHRALASDILVRFDGITDAYNFLKKVALLYIDDPSEIAPEPEYISSKGFCIGDTSDLQFILEHASFDAAGWTDNVVVLNPDEALALGDRREPAGFVPGESSVPWYPERRSNQDLDMELHNYMQRGEVDVLYDIALGYMSLFSKDEWNLLIHMEMKYVDDLHYDYAVKHWSNAIRIAEGRVNAGL